VVLSNMEGFFDEAKKQALGSLFNGKEKGRPVVGIYCTYCPKELVIAAGAIPVSLCGTSNDTIGAAEKRLPSNLCPLIKSSYGYAITDTCPFFSSSDIIIGETTCDGKKKMFELMQELKPVHVMHLPNLFDITDESNLHLWVQEVRKLKRYLEDNLQVSITDDKLRQAIKLVNEEKQLMKNICYLNTANPPVINGTGLLSINVSTNFLGEKGESTNALHNLYEYIMQEYKKCYEHVNLEFEQHRPRILLTGCPVGIGTEKVIRLVEESGGNVVAMENCSSYKTLEIRPDLDATDPLESIAREYLKIPCSCMSPNNYRIELLKQLIDDFAIHGIIDLTWQACHTYNIEAHYIEQLARSEEIPYLHLESDYSPSDEGHLKVRIDALLEMLSS